jgi:hypothetical protein
MTHNLEWGDVRALFKDLGEVEDERNGNLKLRLGDQAVVIQSPSNSEAATADQVSQIRNFIRTSEEIKANELAHHLLVVIDHAEAKIYRTELKGSVPELVVPYDPEGHKGHVHSAHDYPGHNENPNYDGYFGEVAKHLVKAENILIFGSGAGSSSAMDTFVAWLGEHHKKIADRVIASVVVDQSHLTEGQLLAKAREIYSK